MVFKREMPIESYAGLIEAAWFEQDVLLFESCYLHC